MAHDLKPEAGRGMLLRFPIVPFISLASIGILIGIRFWQLDFDDTYITYRIAENIAGGAGWVYNLGERVNGATSVLWTIMLAVGVWLSGHVSAIAHAIGT